jgi:hypothetical protein
MTYDIELGQGDSDYTDLILYENGVPSDLSGFTITFKMENDYGTLHTITCVPNPNVLASAGGTRIPFTSTHTENSGLYHGKVYLTRTVPAQQVTFPSGSDYISVMIWEAIA